MKVNRKLPGTQRYNF